MNLWTMVVLVVAIGCFFSFFMAIADKRGNIKLEEMKAVNSRIEGLNQSASDDLLMEIRAENEALKNEMAEVKSILKSIEKMMKDIE